MLTFHERYHPLTSRPYLSDHSYMEHQPCEKLRPYVACYWTEKGDRQEGEAHNKVLVIPDTCMDVIIRINHTKQTFSGHFCSIQDQPFLSVEQNQKDAITCFAVRFHFWAAHLFWKLDYNETSNQSVKLEDFDREWQRIAEVFFYLRTTKERINLVEQFLLRRLDLESPELNPGLFNSIEQLLCVPGRISISDVCASGCVSQRHLERLFLRNIGLSPKRISRLIRYQCVWRDMVWANNFDIQDEVHRYGYSDQAHLLKEFKHFHSTTPTEARKLAIAAR